MDFKPSGSHSNNKKILGKIDFKNEVFEKEIKRGIKKLKKDNSSKYRIPKKLRLYAFIFIKIIQIIIKMKH